MAFVNGAYVMVRLLIVLIAGVMIFLSGCIISERQNCEEVVQHEEFIDPCGDYIFLEVTEEADTSENLVKFKEILLMQCIIKEQRLDLNQARVSK